MQRTRLFDVCQLESNMIPRRDIEFQGNVFESVICKTMAMMFCPQYLDHDNYPFLFSVNMCALIFFDIQLQLYAKVFFSKGYHNSHDSHIPTSIATSGSRDR